MKRIDDRWDWYGCCVVQESFGVIELVEALRALPKNVALNNDQLEFAKGLIELLGRDDGDEDDEDGEDGVEGDVGDGEGRAESKAEPVDDATGAAAGAGGDADDVPVDADAPVTSEPAATGGRSVPADAPRVKRDAEWFRLIRTCGDIPCPDVKREMKPIRTLLINDAPFLPDTIVIQYRPRFVNDLIDASWAKNLGVGSLRQLVLTDENAVQTLPCPSTAAMQAFLRQGGDPMNAVGDVCDVADALKCSQMSVLWDCRSYVAHMAKLTLLSDMCFVVLYCGRMVVCCTTGSQRKA